MLQVIKFAGTKIKLGNQVFVVPAISLGKLKQLQPRLEKLDLTSGGMPSSEMIDTVVDMTLAALNRNYPDLTREQLEEMLDLGNLNEVVRIVTGQAGLEPAGKEELEGTAPQSGETSTRDSSL